MTSLKSITVLRLKLIDPEVERLKAIAELCRRAFNAGIEDWLLRRRGKPESEKQSRPGRAKKDGEEKPLSEATKIYHAITAAVPAVGSNIAAHLAREVNTALTSKVDWRQRGEGRWRKKDLILAYEMRPPFRSSLSIPILCSQTRFTFGEQTQIRTGNLERGEAPLEFDLSIRSIPPATQLVLRDIAAGARKFPDSKLVYRDEKNEWFLHMPVRFMMELSGEKQATLWPVLGSDNSGRQSDRPFRLELPDGQNRFVGDGRWFQSVTERLIRQRKLIGWKFRNQLGGGHGRKKYDGAMRRLRNKERNVKQQTMRAAINDVVKQCVRNGVGHLLYRRPSLPLRKKTWFAAQGLEWDWTDFIGRLKNNAARAGIVVEEKELKWKEVFPNANEDESAA